VYVFVLQVVRDKLYAAYYALTEYNNQMQSYVCDTIRSSLCNLTVDEAFESKEDIANDLKKHLTEVMVGYGIQIVTALVTDLSPDVKVRNAMNEINTSKRMKESAMQRAEGEKILKVKRAEAEAESMYLSGVGVARQRKAIMMGLKCVFSIQLVYLLACFSTMLLFLPSPPQPLVCLFVSLFICLFK
jgi:regulator of protease activity HflC (stomatin/prohibitin superfamily)